MNKRIFFIVLILILSALIAFAEIGQKPLKTIGWIPYWDQDNAVASLKKNADKIDYISVFWYRLDENGTLGQYEKAVVDRSIVDFAKNNNVKIMALVANLSDAGIESGIENWDSQRVDKVISSKEARRKHIQELVELVEKNNFDGVDIDYESLKSYQKDNFSEFIKELSRELHRKNKILGVAVYPKTSENNPNEEYGSGAQDLQKIGRYADQVYFMTYLEHGPFSEPGPISSPDWMNQVINYGISRVPRKKVFIGIGLMGVQWIKVDGELRGANGLTYQQVITHSQIQNSFPIWDEKSKSPFFKFNSEGAENTIWFENAESIKLRFDLAKRLRLGGVAFWRLGGEDDRIWSFIK